MARRGQSSSGRPDRRPGRGRAGGNPGDDRAKGTGKGRDAGGAGAGGRTGPSRPAGSGGGKPAAGRPAARSGRTPGDAGAAKGRPARTGGGSPAGGGPGAGPPREPRPGGGRPERDPRPASERFGPRAGRMVVYGRNAVREALRGRRTVHRIWATAGAAAEDWRGAPVKLADARDIMERCGSDAHQGVCAEADPYPYADAAALLRVERPVIVALDEVTDPQNLGAVCRTAECAGATGVVLPERRSAEVTAAVCKASAGAVEHLPVARVRNLADFLGEAKRAGCWCYGAAADARTSYDAPDWTDGVVVVLGAEGVGLRPRVAASCDELIALPLVGRVRSLNVSATAAVVLYEILQRRSGP